MHLQNKSTIGLDIFGRTLPITYNKHKTAWYMSVPRGGAALQPTRYHDKTWNNHVGPQQYQFTNSKREQYYAYKNKPFIYQWIYACA